MSSNKKGNKGGGGRGDGQQNRGPTPKREGDWSCSNSKCNANNFARNTQCFKCNTPKGQASSGQNQGKPKSNQAKGGPQVHPQQQNQPQRQGWGNQQQSKPQQGWGPTVSQAGGSAPSSQQQSQPEGFNKPQQSRPQQQRPATTVSMQQQMSTMQVSTAPPGQRTGTLGKPCVLKINYLPVLFKNLCDTVYHYDVRFDPDATKKLFTAAVDAFMRAHFPKVVYAHDGRNNLYTTTKMNLNGQSVEKTVNAVLGDRSKEYKVKVQFAREIDMTVLKNFPNVTPKEKPFDAIQALNIIIRQAFRSLIAANRGVQSGASLYFPPVNPRDQYLADNLDLWYGLFQSVVMGTKTIYLNVDVSHKGFPSQMSILDVIKSFSRDGNMPRSLQGRDFYALDAHLKMLDITYKGKRRRFGGFGGPANKETFEKDGRRITIEQYFRSIGEPLRFPDYNVIKLGGKTMVPLEFCTIPGGQATNKKTTPRVTAAMIKLSATSTEVREKKIMDHLGKVNYDAELRDFGIDIRKEFEKVKGRVIDPPGLKYSNGFTKPAKGVWKGGDFVRPAEGEEIKWAIINCDGYTTRAGLDELEKRISTGARSKKIKFSQKPVAIKMEDAFKNRNFDRDVENHLKEFKSQGVRIVFVVVIDQNDCYAKIKQVAENRLGIMTQCIKAETVKRRLNDMTMNNIMLKVNAKLSGTNHEIINTAYQKHNKKGDGIMFVGADVTHAGPDQRDIPSIVGVCSSYDDVGFKYQCSWRMQKKLKKDNQIEEMILDLEPIMVEHLDRYKIFNGKFPSKIMYYRDGVSEGQFKQVMDIELNAIRKAIITKYGHDSTTHPKVTFIVVQKRHHARFFPTQREFTDGKNNNVPAGTVVDTDVVDPYTFQFFLASHAAIQGVTKPTKYCILHDDSNFNADDLQAITYDLCHLFTRCDRAVSYPAPTYYAHLVAARGKNYTIGKRLNMNKLDQDYKTMKVNDQFNGQFPMFFV